jgi:hypothetical protein
MLVVLLKMATTEVSNILKYQDVTFDLSPERVITNLIQITKAEKVEHEREKREYDTHTEEVKLIAEWRTYKITPTIIFRGQRGENRNFNLAHSWSHRMYNYQPLNII